MPSPMHENDSDFVNLILLLGSTANLDLGFRSQGGNKKEQDLPRARQIINMLMTLVHKTAGHRSVEEDKVLQEVLNDLQQKYVKAAGLNETNRSLATWAALQYGKQQKKPPAR